MVLMFETKAYLPCEQVAEMGQVSLHVVDFCPVHLRGLISGHCEEKVGHAPFLHEEKQVVELLAMPTWRPRQADGYGVLDHVLHCCSGVGRWVLALIVDDGLVEHERATGPC